MPISNSRKNVEILLISPPSSKGKCGRGHFFTPPMCLAYLSSSLQNNGISVDIIDCDPAGIYIDYFSPSKAQEKKLADVLSLYNKPLIVGIGPLTTPFLINGLAIAKFVKNHFKNTYVVVGGPHPSTSPPEMARRMLEQFEYVDAICINEGEKTLLELVSKLKAKYLKGYIKGLVKRSKTGYAYKKRNLMNSKELNLLPFPDRDLLKKYLDKYRLATRRSFLKILSDDKMVKKYGRNPKFAVLFSSRGCPYRCTFCCSLNQRRLRSPENIVSEIEFIVNNYNTHCLIFYDDLFMTGSAEEIMRIKKLCNLLLQKDFKVFWEVELRADVICKIGQKVLNLMNRVGCCTVNIGIEKATDEALKWLNKELSVKEIRKAIRMLRESGDFTINGTFILGGFHETEQDILNIISFSKDIGLDYSAYYLLEIHPGTAIFDIAKGYGLVKDILDSYISRSNNYPIFTNENLDLETLMELQCRAYREFYFDTENVKSLIDKSKSVSTVYKQYEHFFEHAFIKGIR